MKWYVIHTHAAHENKVRTAIEKGLAGTPMEALVGQLLVPVRTTFIIRDGKKIERERKLFTSYVLIECDMTPELRAYIQNIAGVTNFLGQRRDQKELMPLTDEEVNRLLGITDKDRVAKTKEYLPGDMVKIISGPFTDFEGVVQKINDDSTKLVIDVTVFGRRTPVELNADQVEQIKK